MAKVTVTGNAVVITSAIKLEDLRKIEKYRPDALVLKGGEDGKEELFRVRTTSGNGRINRYGAEFGAASHGEEKLATITMMFEPNTDDVENEVAEMLGVAIISLNKVEKLVPDVLASIDGERAEVLSHISVQ